MSWQITPRRLLSLLTESAPMQAQAAMHAMMGMTRIDIAALERAADGAVMPA